MRYLMLLVLPFIVAGVFAQSGQYDDLIDQYFGTSGQLTSFMLDQLGSGVLSILHPTCTHTSTTIVSRDTRNVRFRTNYKGWVNNHTLIWEVTLSPNTLIDDYDFISDTSPIPSGLVANRVKSTLVSVFSQALRR